MITSGEASGDRAQTGNGPGVKRPIRVMRLEEVLSTARRPHASADRLGAELSALLRVSAAINVWLDDLRAENAALRQRCGSACDDIAKAGISKFSARTIYRYVVVKVTAPVEALMAVTVMTKLFCQI